MIAPESSHRTHNSASLDARYSCTWGIMDRTSASGTNVCVAWTDRSQISRRPSRSVGIARRMFITSLSHLPPNARAQPTAAPAPRAGSSHRPPRRRRSAEARCSADPSDRTPFSPAWRLTDTKVPLGISSPRLPLTVIRPGLVECMKAVAAAGDHEHPAIRILGGGRLRVPPRLYLSKCLVLAASHSRHPALLRWPPDPDESTERTRRDIRSLLCGVSYQLVVELDASGVVLEGCTLVEAVHSLGVPRAEAQWQEAVDVLR